MRSLTRLGGGGLGGMSARRTFVAGGTPTPTPTPTPSDTTPDAFAFVDQAGAELSTATTSNQLTLAGTDANAPIAITGGEYQVGAGSWTASSGTIAPGSLFRVRLTSSASYSTIASATLTIGGVSDTFSVETKPAPTPTPTPSEVAWTPAMIAPRAWLSSTDATSYRDTGGVQAAVGTPVETWQDISGNARHALSAATGNGASASTTRGVVGAAETLGSLTVSPLRVGNAVRTNRYNLPTGAFGAPSGGAGDYLMVFARVRVDATALRTLIGHQQSNFLTVLGVSDSGSNGRVWANGGSAGTGATAKVDTSTRLELLLYEKVGSAANVAGARINGAETFTSTGTGTTSLPNTGRVSIGNIYGGSQGADADLFEVISIPAGTSRANLQRLEGWIAHTYGQTALLPAGHPYKAGPPTVPTGTTSTATWTDANFAQAQQTWIGPMAELQADSYDGLVASDPPIDGSSQIWGFPYSLTTGERARLKAEYFPGGGVGYQFLRFPLGFAYRGVRATTAGLGTKIGERFAGQNASIVDLLSNVVNEGGGLFPEYWSPAPYWKTNSAYGGGAGQGSPNPAEATLWAGASYARTVTLDSIRASDPTQYAAQIAALTDAMLDDLEYLHANVGPVRGFSLQNEPQNPTNDSYGHCVYTDQLYVDVISVLWPKVKASAALATWGGQPNAPKLMGTSYQVPPAALSAASVYADWFAAAVHYIPAHYTDGDYPKGQAASWATAAAGKPIINNEFEYFVLPSQGEDWQFANTALVQANYMALSQFRAPTHNPMIHLIKPLGQTSAASNTKGYASAAARLPAPFSQAPTTPGDEYPAVGHGEYVSQGQNANAVKAFWSCVAGSTVHANSFPSTTGCQVVSFTTPAGKRGYIVVNRTASALAVTLGFGTSRTVAGKRFDKGTTGASLGNVTASVVSRSVAAYSVEVWIAQ